MIEGEKCYKNGVQVALFPMDYLYCIQKTQVPSYSHCCGTATDWIGPRDKYPIYAPCDCHEVACNALDTKAYRSDKPVLTPYGVRYITFGFTHDETPPTKTTFKQGELIAHTGNQSSTGISTRDHLHIDQTIESDYYIFPSGQICESGSECWELYGGILVNDAFYLSGKETIIDLNGINFSTIHGTSIDIYTLALIRNLAKSKKKKRKIIIKEV